MQEALEMTSEEMDFAAAELLHREQYENNTSAAPTNKKHLGNNNHHMQHKDPQL